MTVAAPIPVNRSDYFCFRCLDSGKDEPGCWYTTLCPQHGRATTAHNAAPVATPNVRTERWVNGGEGRQPERVQPQGQVTRFRDGFLEEQYAAPIEDRMLANAEAPRRALPPRPIPRHDPDALKYAAADQAEQIVRRAFASLGVVGSAILEALIHLAGNNAPSWPDLLEWLNVQTPPLPLRPPPAVVSSPAAGGATPDLTTGDDDRPIVTIDGTQYRVAPGQTPPARTAPEEFALEAQRAAPPFEAPLSVAAGTLTQTESVEEAAAAIDAALAERRQQREAGNQGDVQTVDAVIEAQALPAVTRDTDSPAKVDPLAKARAAKAAKKAAANGA